MNKIFKFLIFAVFFAFLHTGMTFAQNKPVLAINDQIHRQILSEYKLNENQAISNYVTSIGLKLVKYSSKPNLNYKFYVLNNEEINAFATSEGYIYITTGMLKFLESESELAAVLSHETGHIVSNHSIKQGILNTCVEFIAKFFGKVFGFNADSSISKLTQTVLCQRFSQKEEIQADRIGTLIMSNAGYSPSGMIKLQENLLQLEQRDILAPFLSSHPSGKIRIEKANEYISVNGLEKSTQITDSENFHSVLSKNL